MRYSEIINEINMSPTGLLSGMRGLNAGIGIEYEFVYIENDLEEMLNRVPDSEREIQDAFIFTGDFRKDMWKIVGNKLRNVNNEISTDELINQTEEILSGDIGWILERLNVKTYKDIIEKYKLELSTKFKFGRLSDKLKSFIDAGYILKTDASIKDNDYSELVGNRIGVELVSPVLSFDDTIKDLEIIRKFILENGNTNDTTGLHINVSLPNYDHNKIDFVKLVLLVGDRYILSKFDRSFNKFALSSLGMLRNAMKQDSRDFIEIIDKFKNNLNNSAGTMYMDINLKDVSIGLKTNRIEFRSPGGNWIENIDPEFMKNVIMRFIVALDAALDSTKYQKEYMKKLYKSFTGIMGNNESARLFSLYFAGEITRSSLQSRLKNIRSKRKEFNDFLDSIDIDDLR